MGSRPFRSRLTAACVPFLVLVGCTDGGDPPSDGTDVADDGADAVDDAPDDGGADDGVADDEGEPEAEPTAGGRLQLTGYREDQDGGASIRLTAIEVDGAGNVFVEFEGINAGQQQRLLNGLATIFVDDVGNEYPLVEPADNAQIQVPRDSRVTARLAFEGPVDPGARYVTLGLNQRTGQELVSATDAPASDQFAPFLFVDLPLPGLGLEEDATNPAAELDDTVEVEVGLTQEADNVDGVEVTVVGYRTDGRTLFLDLEAVNASSEAVRLFNEIPQLSDDLGSSFGFQLSEATGAERTLELASGDEASATLAFRATLNPGASTFTLELNSLTRRTGTGTAPTFLFEFPAPETEQVEQTQEADG